MKRFVALVCLAACSADSSDLSAPSMVRIDASGGTFTFGDTELFVPEGAVSEPVEVRLVETDEPIPQPFEGLSALWRAEPSELVFDLPVRIALPFRPRDTPDPRLFWAQPGGGDLMEVDGAEIASGRLSGEVLHLTSGLVAEPVFPSVQTDTLWPPADVLFVIDNSPSMLGEQQTLADGMQSVFPSLLDAGIDFHVGVVTTDMDAVDHRGQLQPSGSHRWVDATTPGPASVFASMALVGNSGSQEERGRDALYTAAELRSDDPANIDFFRDDARLVVIFVSDEDDDSVLITRAEFADWFGARQSGDAVIHSFVAIDLDEGCWNAAEVGSHYLQYAAATGGIEASVCEADWSTPLQQMFDGLGVARVVLPAPGAWVEVTHLPPGGSEVRLHPSDYSFEPDTRLVLFDRGWSPAPGDSIRVVYDPH